MKLLLINSTVNIGSTGRIVEQIARHCLRRGHEVHIAYGRRAQASEAQLVRVGSRWGQALHLVATRLFDTHGFHSKKATKQLASYIEAYAPDVIHLHNLHGYYLHVGVLFEFLERSRIPVVWTLHDCWAFTGHCCYYVRADCRKWENECGACPLSHLYPASLVKDNSRDNYFVKRELFNRLDRLILVTVSRWLKRQVERSFLSSHSVMTIYNGIDLSAFHPQGKAVAKRRLGLEGKHVVLGVANHWSEGKGAHVLQAVASLLAGRVEVVLVGHGLERVSRVGGMLRVVERTDDVQQLADYFRAADVFVSPSIAETFGMVVAEALACGTPCVVRNGTALGDLVDSSVGAVVEGDDPERYALAIKDVLGRNPHEMAKSCRRRAESLFSLDARMDEYLGLYESLLKENGETGEHRGKVGYLGPAVGKPLR